MVTLESIIYDILNIARNNKISDDDLLDPRQIARWIHSTRALLIRQDLNKNHTISSNILQSLGCVSTQQVDLSSCCNIVTDCNAVRSKLKIPTAIELHSKDLISRVGPTQLTEQGWQIIPTNRVPFAFNNKFTKNLPKVFILDRYVYILGPDEIILNLSTINIQGVFENPVEVTPFKNCDGSTCFSEEGPYPISEHMLEPLKQLIIKNNLQITLQVPEDRTNDAQSNPEAQGKG